MKISPVYKSFLVIALLIVLGGMTACAGSLPGGDDDINKTYYESEEDFLAKVDKVEVGMTEEAVFRTLGRSENEMTKLDRAQILTALYGDPAANIDRVLEDDTGQTRFFIKSLSGYSLPYKFVDRKHGLSSPIRLKTNENGYRYTATFVFRYGRLMEEPIISGGLVNESKSRTIFDYLNPLSLLAPSL